MPGTRHALPGEHASEHLEGSMCKDDTLASRTDATRMLLRTKNVVAKGRYEEQCCRRIDNVRESLTALKHELTEPQHENVSINMITTGSVQREPMDAQQDSKPGVWGVNLGAGYTNFVTNHKGYNNNSLWTSWWIVQRSWKLEKSGN